MLPLDAAILGLAGLGSINLVAPPSRRPKDYASSPLRPFTVSAPSPSHPLTVAPLHRRTPVAADPQTPQTPQPPLKAANISKRPQSNSKKPPHRIGRHQIDIDKKGGLSGKARLPVCVKTLWPSLFRAGRHARNQTGILDRSGGKPAGLRLTSALRRHAKNNAR